MSFPHLTVLIKGCSVELRGRETEIKKVFKSIFNSAPTGKLM